MRRTGWFRCSDDRINALHDITDWSFRDNACEIPTDCRSANGRGGRETGSCSSRPAAFLYDVAGFPSSGCAIWLRRTRGRLRDEHVPDPIRYRNTGGFWRRMQGSSGWGDAIVIVPWRCGAPTATCQSWTSFGRTWWRGWTSRPRRRWSATRIGPWDVPRRAARAVPLGRRLPLGGVARAGVVGARALDQGPRLGGHGVPASVGRSAWHASVACSATTHRQTASRSWRPMRSTRIDGVRRAETVL